MVGWITGEASILWVPICELILSPILILRPAAFPFSHCDSPLTAFLIPLSYSLPFSHILLFFFLTYFLPLHFHIIYSSSYGFPIFLLSFLNYINSQIDTERQLMGGKLFRKGRESFVCVCVSAMCSRG